MVGTLIMNQIYRRWGGIANNVVCHFIYGGGIIGGGDREGVTRVGGEALPAIAK